MTDWDKKMNMVRVPLYEQYNKARTMSKSSVFGLRAEELE